MQDITKYKLIEWAAALRAAVFFTNQTELKEILTRLSGDMMNHAGLPEHLDVMKYPAAENQCVNLPNRIENQDTISTDNPLNFTGVITTGDYHAHDCACHEKCGKCRHEDAIPEHIDTIIEPDALAKTDSVKEELHRMKEEGHKRIPWSDEEISLVRTSPSHSRAINRYHVKHGDLRTDIAIISCWKKLKKEGRILAVNDKVTFTGESNLYAGKTGTIVNFTDNGQLTNIMYGNHEIVQVKTTVVELASKGGDT